MSKFLGEKIISSAFSDECSSLVRLCQECLVIRYRLPQATFDSVLSF